MREFERKPQEVVAGINNNCVREVGRGLYDVRIRSRCESLVMRAQGSGEMVVQAQKWSAKGKGLKGFRRCLFVGVLPLN